MSAASLDVFVVWAAAAVFIGLSVFVGIPRIARVWFQMRFESLSEACEDAIARGELPDCPATRRFLERQDVIGDNAAVVTLTKAGSVKKGLDRARVKLPQLQHSYKELAPKERKMLHGLEREAIRVLSTYLALGSPLGWLVSIRSCFRYALSSALRTNRSNGRMPPPSRGRVGLSDPIRGVAQETRDLEPGAVPIGFDTLLSH